MNNKITYHREGDYLIPDLYLHKQPEGHIGKYGRLRLNYLKNFDKFCEKILRNVSKDNKQFVQSQLDKLYDDFMKYLDYCCEKYYRNGFCDATELISGCFNN